MQVNYRIITELSILAQCDPSTRFNPYARPDKGKGEKPSKPNTGQDTKQSSKSELFQHLFKNRFDFFPIPFTLPTKLKKPYRTLMNSSIEKLVTYINKHIPEASNRMVLVEHVLEIRSLYINDLEKHNNTLEELIQAKKKIRALEEQLRLSY